MNYQGDHRTETEFERETIVSEHIEFHSILLRAIDAVRFGLTADYDAGSIALLSLIALLPSKIRKQFKQDSDELSEILISDQYAEKGNLRITRRVRSRYALRVSQCLSRICDSLDEAGMLWKARIEPVGGEK